MDTAKRKALRDSYQAKPSIGGIYRITCRSSQRRWVKASPDIEGIRNRFSFAVATNTSPEPAMQKECTEYGVQSLTLDILETLEKKETQTVQDFAEELGVLLDLWLEKGAGERL